MESFGNWMDVVYLNDAGAEVDDDDDDELDCFLLNFRMEEVVAAASDDPTNPSALFRKYDKIKSKCFGSRSINTASETDELLLLLFAPAYSELASARRT